MSLRRRSESDGGPARAPLALARDARRRSAAQLSRSSPAGWRQSARRVARESSAGAGPAARAVDRRIAAAVWRGGGARGAVRRAAGSLFARVDAERHARSGAREGARVRGAHLARRGALAMETG